MSLYYSALIFYSYSFSFCSFSRIFSAMFISYCSCSCLSFYTYFSQRPLKTPSSFVFCYESCPCFTSSSESFFQRLSCTSSIFCFSKLYSISFFCFSFFIQASVLSQLSSTALALVASSLRASSLALIFLRESSTSICLAIIYFYSSTLILYANSLYNLLVSSSVFYFFCYIFFLSYKSYQDKEAFIEAIVCSLGSTFFFGEIFMLGLAFFSVFLNFANKSSLSDLRDYPFWLSYFFCLPRSQAICFDSRIMVSILSSVARLCLRLDPSYFCLVLWEIGLSFYLLLRLADAMRVNLSSTTYFISTYFQKSILMLLFAAFPFSSRTIQTRLDSVLCFTFSFNTYILVCTFLLTTSKRGKNVAFSLLSLMDSFLTFFKDLYFLITFNYYYEREETLLQLLTLLRRLDCTLLLKGWTMIRCCDWEGYCLERSTTFAQKGRLRVSSSSLAFWAFKMAKHYETIGYCGISECFLRSRGLGSGRYYSCQSITPSLSSKSWRRQGDPFHSKNTGYSMIGFKLSCHSFTFLTDNKVALLCFSRLSLRRDNLHYWTRLSRMKIKTAIFWNWFSDFSVLIVYCWSSSSTEMFL